MVSAEWRTTRLFLNFMLFYSNNSLGNKNLFAFKHKINPTNMRVRATISTFQCFVFVQPTLKLKKLNEIKSIQNILNLWSE